MTTIDPAVRQSIYEEAGTSAHAAVACALGRWQIGNRVSALQIMWDDGADRDWLVSFARRLGATDAHALVNAVDTTREDW